MEKEIGKVSHFFGRIGVAAIEITSDGLAVGETIHIKGATTDFTETIASMQIQNQNVQSAKPGDSVGIKVSQRVREGDIVYKVLPDY
jgi:putative protease